MCVVSREGKGLTYAFGRDIFEDKRRVKCQVMMPFMDGFQVFELLQQELKTVPLQVMVLTADDEEETKNRALIMGAWDFLLKPFQPLEAVKRIHNILESQILYKKLARKNTELEALVEKRSGKYLALEKSLLSNDEEEGHRYLIQLDQELKKIENFYAQHDWKDEG